MDEPRVKISKRSDDEEFCKEVERLLGAGSLFSESSGRQNDFCDESFLS